MIDWNRINELRAEIGEDDFAEVLNLFFEDIDEAVASLRSATGHVPLAEALHFLKGSAENIGLSEVSALCRQEEAKLANAGNLSPDIEAIVVALAAARDGLGDHGP